MFFTSLLLTGATITLPAKAEVRGTEIELGELATISCKDDVLRQQLEAFDLGYAPAPGFSRLFESERIVNRLKTSFPGIDVRIAGELRCRAHPETELVPAANITAVARQGLTSLADGLDAEFAPLGELMDLLIPAGNAKAELRLRRGPLELRSGKNSIPIEVLIDGSPYQTVWTNWDVKIWKSALVLTRDIPAGETLSFDSVEFKRLDSAELSSQLTIDRAALGSTRAARNLKRGAVLTKTDIVQLELIHRGDSIVLEVKKGAVCARVTAIASEDGHLGDRIRVVTTDSKRELSAVVIGRDRVQIDMTATR